MEDYLKEALDEVDCLVEETLIRCRQIAEDIDIEPNWFLDQFREKFNKIRRREPEE